MHQPIREGSEAVEMPFPGQMIVGTVIFPSAPVAGRLFRNSKPVTGLISDILYALPYSNAAGWIAGPAMNSPLGLNSDPVIARVSNIAKA